jgi:tetratricopeptide (TPR) repeat protein
VAQAIDLRIELRHALGPSANYAKAHDYLCDAEALAKILGDRRRLGWVLANLSHARREVGPDQHSVIETAQRALEIAQELSDGALEGTATQYLGQGYFGIGDFVRAVDLLQRAIAAFDNQPDPDRAIQETRRSYGRTWLTHALAALGRFAEGIAVGEEAIRTAEAANRPSQLVLALSALGGLLIAKGDPELAIPLLERAVAISRAFEISFGNTPALAQLARGYALADRVDEAIPLAEQTVSALDPASAMLVAAEVYIAARRVGEASAMLERTLVLVRKRAERALQAQALALLGRIAAERDLPEVEEANVRYRDALALADPLGMRPLVAHCHLGLGKLYGRTDKREQAQEHLTTATTMYREMGMTYWLERAEAEATGLA